jgi:hypothetical protein
MFSMTSRQQVVSLTSAILMIALITNIVGWIQDAEATPDEIVTQNITHTCVDTDHPYQSDICQSVSWTSVIKFHPPDPHPSSHAPSHAVVESEDDYFWSTGVTSCNQCPNPPFTHYN